MLIERIETITCASFPNLLWCRLHTDRGIVGVGETIRGPKAVEAYIHETAAHHLLGQDPRTIERHVEALFPRHGFLSNGVEFRGNSAIEIALWDVLGQHFRAPVVELLGGRLGEPVRLYNTCAGPSFGTKIMGSSANIYSGDRAADGATAHDDLDGFMNRPEELARELLDQGITAMKIWPFDPYTTGLRTPFISAADLERGVEPFKRIRAAFGNRMEMMCELHSRWSPPAARRICDALEPLNLLWIEDPVLPDDLPSLRDLASSIATPLCMSEVMGSRRAFRGLLEARAVGIVMIDLTWSGGISEGKKIASLAEAFDRPVTIHDCTGPIALTAAAHLISNLSNAINQEFVRAFYHGWYRDIVTVLPPVADGRIAPPDGAGLGTALREEFLDRDDVRSRFSSVAGRS